MSCCKVQCDDMGNNAIWVEDKYFLWLCIKHYNEYLDNHKEYGHRK